MAEERCGSNQRSARHRLGAAEERLAMTCCIHHASSTSPANRCPCSLGGALVGSSNTPLVTVRRLLCITRTAPLKLHQAVANQQAICISECQTHIGREAICRTSGVWYSSTEHNAVGGHPPRSPKSTRCNILRNRDTKMWRTSWPSASC